MALSSYEAAQEHFRHCWEWSVGHKGIEEYMYQAPSSRFLILHGVPPIGDQCKSQEARKP